MISQSDPTCAENAHGPIIFCIAEFIIQELVKKKKKKEQVLYLITNWLVIIRNATNDDNHVRGLFIF